MKNKKESWLEGHITLPILAHPEEEKQNWISHAIPAIFSVIGLLYILINLSSITSNTVKIGMIIFAFSNILLYGASALYHYLPTNNAKRFFRILDHSNIYFLIAGTYTPVLLYVGSPISILLFKIIWIIAFAGIAFTLIFWGRLKPLHVILYIIMGWIIVFFWKDIVVNTPENLSLYLITGGLIYTIGVFFYGNKKIPHGHFVWHLFTTAGSLSFYIGFLHLLM